MWWRWVVKLRESWRQCQDRNQSPLRVQLRPRRNLQLPPGWLPGLTIDIFTLQHGLTRINAVRINYNETRIISCFPTKTAHHQPYGIFPELWWSKRKVIILGCGNEAQTRWFPAPDSCDVSKFWLNRRKFLLAANRDPCHDPTDASRCSMSLCQGELSSAPGQSQTRAHLPNTTSNISSLSARKRYLFGEWIEAPKKA